MFLRSSVDQVKIFVQGRISRPINGSKLVFHMKMRLAGLYKSHDLMTLILLTSDFGQFSMVKIFVIGRLLSSVDGSKLIFY